MSTNNGFNLDITLCIDVSGGMVPFLENFRHKSHSFYDIICDEYITKGLIAPDKVRVKMIAFKDYSVDPEPMVESEFFSLENEDERNDFVSFTDYLDAMGGGDMPECSLEALALAMKSPWTEKGVKKRHIIALVTDAPPKPLSKKNLEIAGYPEDMPKSEKELEALWNEMSVREKRLLIFAPKCEEWQSFAEGWEGVVHKENVRFLGGCDDVDVDALARMIADIGR